MSDTILSRWSDVADQYDDFRPPVPDPLIVVLTRVARNDAPSLVVDLGSGTGLSTRAWSRHARRVIGVEPSAGMLRTARTRTTATHIEFVNRFAHDTGLDDACADIVCAASSIHWMEPAQTLAEMTRILKPEGVFSFFGPSFPPVSPFLVLDRSFGDFVSTIARLQDAIPQPDRWTWRAHLDHIAASGSFPLTRSFSIHHEVAWDAEAYLNWVKTTNGLPLLFAAKHRGAAEAFDRLAGTVRHWFRHKTHPCLFVFGVHVFGRDPGEQRTP